MARPKETGNKKEVQKQKEKRKKEKEKKKLERKENSRDGNKLDDMIAYVDEYGNITDTPPDLSKRKEVRAEDMEISTPKRKETDDKNTIRKGIVSFYNDSKGYGFIKDMDTKESIFVHVYGLIDPIKENNIVTFEVEKSHKGINAINVKLVK